MVYVKLEMFYDCADVRHTSMVKRFNGEQRAGSGGVVETVVVGNRSKLTSNVYSGKFCLPMVVNEQATPEGR